MRTTFLPRRRSAAGLLSLQITSMADIFMILLVFLLKSYSTTITNLSVGRTRLPVANAKNDLKDALKIEVSRDAVLVDEKPIVSLSDFRFQPGEAPSHGSSGPLYRVLLHERQKKGTPNLEASALLLADERTPYDTLSRVLAAASHTGFVDMQLVVVKRE